MFLRSVLEIGQNFNYKILVKPLEITLLTGYK